MLYSLCFFLPTLLSAQIRIDNISLKRPDSSLLYIGVENIIKISGIEKNAYTQLKSSGGELKNIGNGQYSLWVNSVKQPDTLTVYQDGKVLSSRIFTVKLLSEPVLKLGAIQSNYATVDEIKRNSKLQMHLPNWEYKAAFKVMNFRLTILNHFGKIVSSDEINVGNAISAEQLKIIKKLEQNSKLIFENVKVVGPDQVERTATNFIVTVK